MPALSRIWGLPNKFSMHLILVGCKERAELRGRKGRDGIFFKPFFFS